MIPAKPNWQKILHWLSPLLLVSLVLHGLVMVIPVPDPEEVVEEPDVELPDPISVTELPPGIEPEPEASVPDPIFIPPPPPEVVEPPAPVLQPPVFQTSPPTIVPIPELPEELPDEPPDEPPAEPDPAFEQNDSDPKNPPDTENSSEKPTTIRQAYIVTGTSEKESQTTLLTLIQEINQGFNIPIPDEIKQPLSLNYPVGERCFENDSTSAVYTELDSYGIVVIGSYQDSGGEQVVSVVETKVARSTGFDSVNDWIAEVLYAEGDVDVIDWIRNNADSTTFDSEEVDEAYMFPIRVELVGSEPCR